MKISNFWTFLQVWGHEIFQKSLGPYIQNTEPKTHRNYPKCCSERELRLSWWFWVKQFFWKNFKFLKFFAGPGSWDFPKITRSLNSKCEPKTHRNYPKSYSECLFGLAYWFREKQFFWKNLKFLIFFAGPGSRNFSKITRSLYSKYEPKTHWNYIKCCSERELRLSWRFRVKNFFEKISNFWTFFAGPGSSNFSKITRSLYSKYEPKIHRNYPKCCSERELRIFLMVSSKKIFWKNFKFFDFFAGPG